MFVHAVYFWLRPTLTDAERARFVAGLHALRGIEDVRDGHVAVPAPTERTDVEQGFSYALVLVFDDAARQDAYQRHPTHDRFRDDCRGFWDDIRIYDAVTEAPPSRA